jgi:hypothetical protein
VSKRARKPDQKTENVGTCEVVIHKNLTVTVSWSDDERK